MLLKEVISTGQFLTNFNDIKKWLESNEIHNYTINPATLVVDVNNSVTIYWMSVKDYNYSLPVQFGQVSGDFKFTRDTRIKTLQGSPKFVGGTFACSGNKELSSAVGGPEVVKINAQYSETAISTLHGLPIEVGVSLYIDQTNITSISNIHKFVKLIGEDLYLGRLGTKLNSGILGCLLIKKLQSVQPLWTSFKPSSTKAEHAITILNKYLAGDRILTECQIELQDSGLSEFAKL